MKRFAKGAIVTSLALVVPTTLAAPAFAADVTIRGTAETGPQAEGTTPDGDVVENRNLGNGSWEFLREGIVQKAPADGDRSGVYWESNTQEFPDSVSADWVGSPSVDGQTADNAIVIYIDTDGPQGATPRDALLHEDIYGEGDLWLPESGSDNAKAASPGESSGSSFAGPIEEWKTNLEELYPDLTIVQVGSNLSGDGEGNSEGLLRSVTLGDDTYTFTNEDEAPVAPTATDDSYDTDEGQELSVAAPGVLANDSADQDADLTAELDRQALNGTVDLQEDGSFVYTPDEGFSGRDSFTYVANDGTSDSEPARVTITVEPADEPEPVVEDVRGTPSVDRDGNRVEVTFTSKAPRDANATQGEKLRWRVSVNGQVEARIVQGFDEVDTYARRFPANTGTYRIRVVKNGEIVRDFTVNTGNPRR